MGSFSIFHWLLVLAVILILFGAGKLPSVMGDLAKGIKAFRAGLKDDTEKAGESTAAPAAVAPPVAAQPLSAHTAAPAMTAAPAAGDAKPPSP